jgi:hypothetical protein
MLNSLGLPTSSIYPGNIVKTLINTTFTVNPVGDYLPSGKYRVNVHTINNGYCTISTKN